VLLSYVEAEEAFKTSTGRDAHAKLSVKKTVMLLKILYCRIILTTFGGYAWVSVVGCYRVGLSVCLPVGSITEKVVEMKVRTSVAYGA